MGMGGGGSGGAIGAHVHDNNAGQGGKLTTATLLESVTLESRLDPNPATITTDVLTSNDTTTSTSLVNSSLLVAIPNDDKDFLAIANAEVNTDSIGSQLHWNISGGDISNEIDIAEHDTASRNMPISTQTTGTQTGQNVVAQWCVGAGTGSLRPSSNLVILGIGS